MSKKLRKPVPYLVQQDSYPLSLLAEWLRDTFKPLISKRLPTVLYGGFTHNFIVGFIKKHKKAYPYFVKVDIQKFYPSCKHRQLLVEGQMAYKNLLGLKYCPKKFKAQYINGVQSFFNSLPITTQGLPLNSGVSKAIAPLVYIDFFLMLKKQDVKFIVYVDDVIILTKTKAEGTRIYQAFFNFLQSVQLTVQLHKVQQGAFKNTTLEYCGWRFAGGYAGISHEKVKAFKEKIAAVCNNTIQLCVPSFIKKINQNINGFGHYYKYGQVRGVYEKLDAFIRQQIRLAFKLNSRKKPTNLQLKNMGLRSLLHIIEKTKPLEAAKKKFIAPILTKPSEKHQTRRFFGYLEKLTNQNTEIIEQLKKITKLITV